MSDAPTSNQWVSLAERQPPKDCARLLVTNNITARDAYDHFCHLWLAHMVHKQDDGSFAAFDDHDRKIHGLTHWRYAVPEESSVETAAPPVVECRDPNCEWLRSFPAPAKHSHLVRPAETTAVHPVTAECVEHDCQCQAGERPA